MAVIQRFGESAKESIIFGEADGIFSTTEVEGMISDPKTGAIYSVCLPLMAENEPPPMVPLLFYCGAEGANYERSPAQSKRDSP